MKLHASSLLNFNSCEKLVRFLLRKAVLCLTSNKINSLLSPPGPECENEASECPQFHFMPRFVRFLPGKTLNKRQRPTALLSFAICLILVVSGDAVLGLKPATEKRKKGVATSPNLSAYSAVHICSLQKDFQCLSCCVAAWYSSPIHMMVLLHCGICRSVLS